MYMCYLVNFFFLNLRLKFKKVVLDVYIPMIGLYCFLLDLMVLVIGFILLEFN